MLVSKFSAGCSSFAATYIYRKEIDKIVYTHIDDHHPDTMRFVKESEILFGKPIEIIQSHMKTVDEACRKSKFIVGPKGARCTRDLKIAVGNKWEYEQDTDQLTFLWGFDKTERNRADSMEHIVLPQHNHIFPLIEHDMTKKDCHELCIKLGIKRPAMYDLGFPNNN